MSNCQLEIGREIDSRTDVVVEAHQCACEFPFVLHQDPDWGSDTSVYQF